MTDARRHTAWHEGGHSVISKLLGYDVEFVSIRPGVSHSGVSKSRMGLDRRVDLSSLDGELLNADPAARIAVERAVVVALAGQAAAELVTIPATGYSEVAPPTPEAVAAAEALASLSPRHKELLFELEAMDDQIEDDDDALEISVRLAGQEALAHVAFLRAVATRLVWDHARSIAAVAERLLERDVLNGEEVAEIMASVEGAALA